MAASKADMDSAAPVRAGSGRGNVDMGIIRRSSVRRLPKITRRKPELRPSRSFRLRYYRTGWVRPKTLDFRHKYSALAAAARVFEWEGSGPIEWMILETRIEKLGPWREIEALHAPKGGSL